MRFGAQRLGMRDAAWSLALDACVEHEQVKLFSH